MLKQNIIANYVSQIYVTVISIILLPLYIKYMGSEAYGLVGFFALLQAWFSVLDMGLTPTISREAARYNGGASTPLRFNQLYRALLVIFAGVALIGGTVLFLLSELIATHWLNLTELLVGDVIVAVQIMAVCVALRWITGLYRGVITGFEKLVWLSSFTAAIASLRFIGVFLSMWYFGFTPFVFFMHQLVIALIEVVVLNAKARCFIPKVNGPTNIGWSIKPIKSIFKFSLTIALTASIWVLVTQTDKLILSGILSLDSYSYFTLAVLLANGILVLGGPISVAVMPRMASLYAEGKHSDMIEVYKDSSQLVAVIAGTVSLTLIATARPFLLAWTGDPLLVEEAAPVLQLYAAGNLLLSFSSFAYYLQYAKGNLRYHLIGNVGLVAILIPCVTFAANYFGGVGAGYVWLVMNVFYLFIWVAYIHSKIESGLHVKWLINDCLKVILPVSIFACIFYFANLYFLNDNRLYSLVFVGFVFVFLFVISIISSQKIRLFLSQKVGLKRVK
ncbi:polysaccharide biosynthesis protein [Colwellia ponticola]|uniref:Polysaccharide biosynthesis protein n=1 Tax=Colwellia ponticola TaxID=2304625 RepID=A0A8H2JM66_9GAMM|nr:polysaccharide biosynthesis protein [Colwellia ponticola]